MVKISLLKCDDYNKANSAVKEAVNLLGGISAFVKPGEKILIKPNLLSPKEPERAVTTHPAIVKAVIKMVKSAGAVPVVGDSPGGGIRDIENLWDKTGMAAVCKEENTELINFEAAGSKEFDIGDKNVKKVHFSNAVLDCDGIINLPKLKTHSLMTFTAGVKNLYGCIPGLMKVEYHKYASKNEDFAELLKNIYFFLKDKIRFTLIDGIIGMEGNGPSSGEPRKMDMIAASRETYALDAYLLEMLNADISKNHVLKSFEIIKNSIENLEIIGNSAKDFNLGDFKFPNPIKLDLIPRPIVRALGKFLWVKTKINKKDCTRCYFCIKSCPVKAVSVDEKTKYPQVTEEKCISCFCCHELCPYKAVEFKKSFLAKLFIKNS